MDDRSQDLDAIQKTLAEALKPVYPRIGYIAKGMKEGDRPYLLVIVHGSGDRPHFAGLSYVRVGSQTVEASEDQFRELIAQRQSKARLILEWTGKEVMWISRNTHPNKSIYQDSVSADITTVVVGCNSHFATFQMKTSNGPESIQSFPLGRLELGFDHGRGCLQIFYYRDR